MTKPNVIEMHDITKKFGEFVANDHINLDVRPGEIHALLGENGAGKSTLMNMLAGLLQPTSGTIKVNGQVVSIDSPSKATKLGIGMVHQHFMLVEAFTVAENIILGSEVTKSGGVLDMKKAVKEITELSQRYGLAVDPSAKVADISVGAQQRVEILKTLYRGADILIFDEPTAVLTPSEITELLNIMRTLVKEGKSIILITHKLDEIRAVSDRVTVIRRGKSIDTVTIEGSTNADLAEMMVGRHVSFKTEKIPSNPKAVVLSITSEFSGGQKKKVLIARSLCERAHVYVWDEPLNFIDIYSRRQIEALIAAYAPTMLFVEHDAAFCSAIATKSIQL